MMASSSSPGIAILQKNPEAPPISTAITTLTAVASTDDQRQPRPVDMRLSTSRWS